MTTILVQGLPTYSKKPKLHRIFSEFGNVMKIRIFCDPHSRPSGCAKVKFEKSSSAQQVLQSCVYYKKYKLWTELLKNNLHKPQKSTSEVKNSSLKTQVSTPLKKLSKYCSESDPAFIQNLSTNLFSQKKQDSSKKFNFENSQRHMLENASELTLKKEFTLSKELSSGFNKKFQENLPRNHDVTRQDRYPETGYKEAAWKTNEPTSLKVKFKRKSCRATNFLVTVGDSDKYKRSRMKKLRQICSVTGRRPEYYHEMNNVEIRVTMKKNYH